MPYLLRAVPRVAPLRPLYGTSAAMAALVVTSTSQGQANTRFRLGAAAIGACLAFVLDDDAATTTASVPTTRLTRRAARVAFGASLFGAWLVAAAFLADVLVGAGRPPWEFFIEPVAIGALALAVSCLATDRADDGRGGVFGAAAALTCFATVYLPPGWWWPLTAQPEMTRLLVISAAALAVALAASVDPATRRPRWTR